MKKFFLILPLIAGIMWGSVGTFVRKLTEFGMDSRTILFSRGLFAIIMLFLIILIYDRSLLKIKIKHLGVFIGAGILGTLALNLCYNESVKHLTLSFAAVLLSMAPIFVILFSAIFFKEKITKIKVICMCLAIVGCILTSGVLQQSAGAGRSVYGFLIGVGSAFFYSLYNIFTKKGMNLGYHAFTITFYSFLFLTIVTLPMADLSQMGSFISAAPAQNGIFILLHSVFTAVLPYVLYTIGLNHADAGNASILSSGGEPAAAMVFGMILFAEMPTILSVIGLVITIIALAMLIKPPKFLTRLVSQE